MITLDIKDSYSNNKTNFKNDKLLFVSENIVEHKHVENDYNDYEKEVLLPHQNSKLGPGIATGDINGDSLEDFIVGGAKDQPTAFYIQKSDGSFSEKKFSFSIDHSMYEDMDMILEDFDRDGDKDLYIVSGGNEFDPKILVGDDLIRKHATTNYKGTGFIAINWNRLPNNAFECNLSTT